jgi:hypothetical protein
MLKLLQIAFLLVFAAAVACFSAWRYFRGGAWWLTVVGALLAYAALLSSFFWGKLDAWHKKCIRFVFGIAVVADILLPNLSANFSLYFPT